MRSKYVVTDAQQQACAWLASHNSTGVFARDGVLLAAGERAPITRTTWNKLRDAGHLTIEKKRATLTPSGAEIATIKPYGHFGRFT